MMLIASFGKALSNIFSLRSPSKPDAQNQVLCHYGQHADLSYVGTFVNPRAQHAISEFDVKTLAGQDIRVSLTGPELGDALKSYPAQQAECASARILRKAATEAQAVDSSLHKPSQGGHARLRF